MCSRRGARRRGKPTAQLLGGSLQLVVQLQDLPFPLNSRDVSEKCLEDFEIHRITAVYERLRMFANVGLQTKKINVIMERQHQVTEIGSRLERHSRNHAPPTIDCLLPCLMLELAAFNAPRYPWGDEYGNSAANQSEDGCNHFFVEQELHGAG